MSVINAIYSKASNITATVMVTIKESDASNIVVVANNINSQL